MGNLLEEENIQLHAYSLLYLGELILQLELVLSARDILTPIPYVLRVRPISDVVLLPCQTLVQLGLTIAQRKHDSDSDVQPMLSETQHLLKHPKHILCKGELFL